MQGLAIRHIGLRTCRDVNLARTGYPVPRPLHLPDFAKPPLNEVVMGIQFEPVAGYQQIRAGEVWGLFRSDYPEVEEHPPIAPAFETFGLPAGPQLNFGFATGAQHDRFWFLKPQKEELIQFQQDRLLHKRRKIGDGTNPYPRFESMIVNFQSEARKLEDYFRSISSSGLSVNQCELSYINHIEFDGTPGLENMSKWIKFINGDDFVSDDARLAFRSVMLRENDEPFGRIICECNPAVNRSGKAITILNITVRGLPPRPDIAAAIDFLTMAREMIVDLFARITTDSAHRAWGRIS